MNGNKKLITVMKKKFKNSFHDKYLKKWSRNGTTTYTISENCMVSFSCYLLLNIISMQLKV